MRPLMGCCASGQLAAIPSSMPQLSGFPLPNLVASIAGQARVSVVRGSGFYVHRSHAADVCTASMDRQTARLDQEASTGVAGSGILPGILGEIG